MRSRWLPARRALRSPALLEGLLLAVLTGAALVQPVVADIRTTQVLGRTDTRQVARNYLVRHFPRSLRIVIEPAVSDDYYNVTGGRFQNHERQFVRGFVRDLRTTAQANSPLGVDVTYAATLRLSNVDAYRREGFCVIATMSVIRGRVDTPASPRQYAYYQRLVRESKLIYTISPFKPGRRPVPFHFDFSYDYYPTAYYRPGPVVDIYRLGRCKQGFGRVPMGPLGNGGLDKGVATSYSPELFRP